MKSIFLAITLLHPPNYDKLADAIFKHENSIKFPYGAEHRVDGKLVGYAEPKARAICISLCRKAFEHWDGKGDYFQSLNKVYAKDGRWYLDVERIYGQQTTNKKTTKKEQYE